jgi:hypothetical protein
LALFTNRSDYIARRFNASSTKVTAIVLETNSASGAPSHTLGDASRYFFFFAMQTIGAAILFWCAVPLFKQILLDPGGHVARPENLVWSLHPAFGDYGAQLPASGDS